MLNTEDKLNMSLDAVMATASGAGAGAGAGQQPVRRGGRPPPRNKRPREESAEQSDKQGRYLNEAGMEHRAGTGLDDIAHGPAESRVLKVSISSHPKTVAGSICHVTRACGVPPSLLSLGNKPINQAVKAVAIAAQYLSDDGASLSCVPEFRDSARNSVALKLFNGVKLRRLGGGEVELTVSARTESSKLAGAIAAKVREQQRCSIVAIGVDSVAKAIYAIATAREYLTQDDGTGANVGDVHFVPSFVHTLQRTSQEEVSALKFAINVEVRGGGMAAMGAFAAAATPGLAARSGFESAFRHGTALQMAQSPVQMPGSQRRQAGVLAAIDNAPWEAATSVLRGMAQLVPTPGIALAGGTGGATPRSGGGGDGGGGVRRGGRGARRTVEVLRVTVPNDRAGQAGASPF